MKKKGLLNLFVIGLIVFIIGTSCAGFPEPAGDQTVLVTGYVDFTFPNGFFGNNAIQSLKNGIKVKFFNAMTGEYFHVYTRNGYFSFPWNHNHVLYFLYAEIEKKDERSIGTLNTDYYKMEYKPKTGSILYLGHNTFEFKMLKGTERNFRWMLVSNLADTIYDPMKRELKDPKSSPLVSPQMSKMQSMTR